MYPPYVKHPMHPYMGTLRHPTNPASHAQSTTWPECQMEISWNFGLSSAGFRRWGETTAILTIPDTSRRLRAGLPQGLWRGRTKHVTEVSLFRWSNPQRPDGAEGLRSDLDGLPLAIWRVRAAHPGAVPRSRVVRGKACRLRVSGLSSERRNPCCPPGTEPG